MSFIGTKDSKSSIILAGATAVALYASYSVYKKMYEKPTKDQKKADSVKLGIIRLDYDYPPAPGDVDHPDSYEYKVFYRMIPGFTFEMCQSGKMTPEVEKEFIKAINYFDHEVNVDGITGDCGFMMYFQELARQHTNKPVFMSALAQLPAVTCAYSPHEQIAILTANCATLEPMRKLIRVQCGVDTHDKRYHIIGAQNVPGFEAVALGEKVDTAKVEPGIVKLCKDALKEFPQTRAFLFECTELPPYSDAVRFETGLPVFDAITACDFFLSSRMDNPRFGLNNWQEDWDQQQQEYCFKKDKMKQSTNKI